ncbi:hypothetical protein IAT38_002101 [Cryptococcus sp. DSM 104549]
MDGHQPWLQSTDSPTLPYRPIYATPESTLISGTPSPRTSVFSSPPGFPSQSTNSNAATPTRSFHTPYSRAELRSFNVFVTKAREDTSSESESTGDEGDHPRQSHNPGVDAEVQYHVSARAITPPTSPTPHHALTTSNHNHHTTSLIASHAASPTASSTSTESAESDGPQFLYAVRGKSRGRGRGRGGGLARPSLSGLGVGRGKGRGMGRSSIGGRGSRDVGHRASSEIRSIGESSEGGGEESEGSAGWTPRKGTPKKGTPKKGTPKTAMPKSSQKNQGARNGKGRVKGPDGSSCDRCRRQKRHCDSKRPTCGTCASLGRDDCRYTGLGLRRPIPARANPPTPAGPSRADPPAPATPAAPTQTAPPTSAGHTKEPTQVREEHGRKGRNGKGSQGAEGALFVVKELGEEVSGDEAGGTKEGGQHAIGKEAGNEAVNETGDEAIAEIEDEEDAEGEADDGGYETVGEAEAGHGGAAGREITRRHLLRAAAEDATRRIAHNLREASSSSTLRTSSPRASLASTSPPHTPLPTLDARPPTPITAATAQRYHSPHNINHYLSLPLPPLGPPILSQFASLNDICPQSPNRWSSISRRMHYRPVFHPSRSPTPSPTPSPTHTTAQNPFSSTSTAWASYATVLASQELVQRALAQQAEASERARKMAMRIRWERGDGPMWGAGVAGGLEVDGY